MSRIAIGYLKLHGVRLQGRLRMYTTPFCRKHSLAVIEIGSDVIIRNTISENPAGVHSRCVLCAVRPGSKLTIGNHVGMSGVVLYCTEQIVIEDYVNLGAGVLIYDTDFHPLDAADRRVRNIDKIPSAPVRICQDAWIGARAIILKGVTIGPRAVIGAGAVVTNDIPADCIAAGVPARVVGPVKRRTESVL
ncbi:MAG: acyltransferase [Thermodesulfobacteriota bacterium]